MGFGDYLEIPITYIDLHVLPYGSYLVRSGATACLFCGVWGFVALGLMPKAPEP